MCVEKKVKKVKNKKFKNFSNEKNENFLFWACQISEQKAPKEKQENDRM